MTRTVLVTLCILGAPVDAFAQAAMIGATVDGRIIDIGANGFDSVNQTQLFANYESTNEIGRAALEFDLDLLATPTGPIELHLNQISAGGGASIAVEVCGYTGDGSLGVGDALETAQPIAGPIFQTSLGPTIIDVTAFVSARLAGGDRWAGFLLKLNHEATFNDGGFLVSSAVRAWVDTDTAGINPPMLVLATSAVPLLPTWGWWILAPLLCASLALALRARQRVVTCHVTLQSSRWH